MSQPITFSVASQPQRCQYLRAAGHPCPRRALRGELYCYAHGYDLRRQLRSPGRLHIPLLEDRSDLVHLYTDIARAIADGTLDDKRARLLLTVIRSAAQLLGPKNAAEGKAPRRSAARVRSDAETGAHKDTAPVVPAASAPPAQPRLTQPGLTQPGLTQPGPAQVDEYILGPNGEELAPPAPWVEETMDEKDEEKSAAREWSFDRFLRDSLFPDQAGRPLPESGYAPPAPEKPAAPAESQEAESPEVSASTAQPDAAETPHPGIVPSLWARHRSQGRSGCRRRVAPRAVGIQVVRKTFSAVVSPSA
ncbi:hypothetical protein [Silvibacterium dinghuense]|uniref:Uncharacterized protein n=1 Tax=Silvibacterium dinghuense TaxID=1560006 RepID=A0A4Q1SA35_9BACT|nr:hypothetical protein [Silvibacterium dinghuense]RXS93857.1 hypothetical protein ESZ00_17625 [Silvibacterium dinghuense]GGH08272.1 hypothetical protein GCM10011586_25740 [Silvibacterium dinghuense]